MSVYFTSDTHFFHGNVIKYCNRPFSSVEEMNENMIQRWNEKIRDEDIVYHLGDFSINSKEKERNAERESGLRKVFNRLNGKKFLIQGNHDIAFLELYHDLFIDVLPYKEIEIDNKIWVLCHYPIEAWNGSYDGVGVHLHGHSHGKCKPMKNRFDVGVDCNNFYPFELEEIKKKIEN